MAPVWKSNMAAQQGKTTILDLDARKSFGDKVDKHHLKLTQLSSTQTPKVNQHVKFRLPWKLCLLYDH